MKRLVFPLIGLIAAFGVGFGISESRTLFANARANLASLPVVDSEPLALSAEEETGVAVYETVNRSVVNITTRSQPDDDLFSAGPRQGAGSGSILTKQGHVLTNFHVIDGADTASVTLYDGSVHRAQLIGADPNNDLAVLKIDAPENLLNPIGWGDSNILKVGMRVFAIGNPFGLERTMTSGQVSSLNRTLKAENDRIIKGVIQTDAAINPGNSGGPLLNRRGEMIGITTAIVGRAGQSSGIGLAVPSNTARRVVEELIKNGHISRSDIGIQSVFQTPQGLLVARLVPEGPAEKAGLQGPQSKVVQRGGYAFRTIDRSKADLIIEADGKKMKTLDDLLTTVESKKPGDELKLLVLRDGEKKSISVKLTESK